jgi:hypothetical protein
MEFAVILSFGKVFPALLAGDTVVLRASPFNPLTVLRISELIRELVSEARKATIDVAEPKQIPPFVEVYSPDPFSRAAGIISDLNR